MIIGDGDSKKIQKFIKSKRCDAARMDFPKKAELVYSGLRSKANILNEQFCSVVTQEDTTRVVAFQQWGGAAWVPWAIILLDEVGSTVMDTLKEICVFV